ncbi:haloacid dehalogenase-like hydrolase [Agromyces atrinae]|uniref:HAD family hydrolase n=1 Tax=Agromyces atrinae TaxID=592376 RepID=UPI001F577795|nr:HAD family hydrolase [Agromyces atrinae]MCI2957275.1 haloacid dehalogenase-like hydrolase [Agromyces atrinae]
MSTALDSWRPGAARSAIESFVAAVTTGPNAVPVDERIAVFDNDGTLWTEKPMPTQLHFIVEQWARMARDDASLAGQQPYKAALTGDLSWLGHAVEKHYAGDDSDLHLMIGAIVASTANESVEDYQEAVERFYAEAHHPTLGRPYSDAVYRPMVELLRYLEEHGFSCYIVSGGDRDFMRPMTVGNYGIPSERVIGSALGLAYDADTNEIRYGTSFDFMDDGPIKPVRIWSRIGRRPLLAVGNSNGDLPMLGYVMKHPVSLSLLVHHDDDSGRGDAPYDSGAETALAEADERGLVVVSVKDDWANVFPEAVGS